MFRSSLTPAGRQIGLFEIVGAKGAAELGGGAGEDQAAAVQYRETIAEFIQVLQLVRGAEQRAAARALGQ